MMSLSDVVDYLDHLVAGQLAGTITRDGNEFRRLGYQWPPAPVVNHGEQTVVDDNNNNDNNNEPSQRAGTSSSPISIRDDSPVVEDDDNTSFSASPVSSCRYEPDPNPVQSIEGTGLARYPKYSNKSLPGCSYIPPNRHYHSRSLSESSTNSDSEESDEEDFNDDDSSSTKSVESDSGSEYLSDEPTPKKRTVGNRCKRAHSELESDAESESESYVPPKKKVCAPKPSKSIRKPATKPTQKSIPTKKQAPQPKRSTTDEDHRRLQRGIEARRSFEARNKDNALCKPLKDVQFWTSVLAFLEAKNIPVNKTTTGARMYWSRTGRVRSGVDERVNPTGSLITCAQGKKAAEVVFEPYEPIPSEVDDGEFFPEFAAMKAA